MPSFYRVQKYAKFVLPTNLAYFLLFRANNALFFEHNLIDKPGCVAFFQRIAYKNADVMTIIFQTFHISEAIGSINSHALCNNIPHLFKTKGNDTQ